MDFVSTNVETLLHEGAISETSTPKVVNPVFVVESLNKLRFIIDVRYVNLFVKLKNFQDFHYESINDAVAVMDGSCTQDFAVKFDIKNDYYHVPVSKKSNPYLTFSWNVIIRLSLSLRHNNQLKARYE